MAPAPPTDAQLADIVRFTARICLEVERGLRPADHLLRLMDPAAAKRWPRTERIGRFPGGPVQRSDVGPPHLSRLSDRHVVATVTTRTEPDRWGALTLDLRSDGRRWSVSELQRVLAAADNLARPRLHPPQPVPLDQQLRRTSYDRRLASAALTATTRRLADLTRTDPRYHTTAQMARTWRRVVARLDHELGALRSRAHAAAATGRSALR